jgi:hypothetical protein
MKKIELEQLIERIVRKKLLIKEEKINANDIDNDVIDDLKSLNLSKFDVDEAYKDNNGKNDFYTLLFRSIGIKPENIAKAKYLKSISTSGTGIILLFVK